MGKKDTQQNVAQEKQKNKSHKTLRQKLRKKRLQEKEHLKQKKQKRKQFDPQAQKRSFFIEHFNSISEDKYKEAKKQFKYKKVSKYIEKFINVYQDDLEDFFGLFKQFDEGGFIDISGLENKKLHKILVKLFGELPLRISERNEDGKILTEYRKKIQSTVKLENIIRELVRRSIQNYMQNGTDDEKEKEEDEEKDEASSEDEEKQRLKEMRRDKRQRNVRVKIRNEDDDAVFTLPKVKQQQKEINVSYGPLISAEQRQKIAQMFERQLQQMQREKQRQRQEQQGNFERIFKISTESSNKLTTTKKGQKVSVLEDFPQQLMAEGSARIGEKISLNEEDQRQYDAIHRPRRLIDEHRQMMAINRGQGEDGKEHGIGKNIKQQRRPFDRERDVVNSRSRFGNNNINNGNGMNNGLFFNFGEKMTPPKKTNSFL